MKYTCIVVTVVINIIISMIFHNALHSASSFSFIRGFTRARTNVHRSRNACSLLWMMQNKNKNDKKKNGIKSASKRSYENILNGMYRQLNNSSYSTSSSADDNDLIILQHSGYTAHVVTRLNGLTLHQVLEETIRAVKVKIRNSVVDKSEYLNNDDGEKNMNMIVSASVDELISLGSVWYLPPGSPRDPALGIKPIRCMSEDDDARGNDLLLCASSTLEAGTYLRVHHTPRRFPAFHQYDWGGTFNEAKNSDNSNSTSLPGVIVGEDVALGYRIIMKPEDIPVHATVDNALENVAVGVQRSVLDRQGKSLNDLRQQRIIEEASMSSKEKQLNQRKQKVDPLVYVSTPQRLDHDTAGLLAVSTKPEFAAYFAKLLRSKTDWHLSDAKGRLSNPSNTTRDPIAKKYKCAVCISPQPGQSIYDELNRLRNLQSNNEVITHYLAPSIRAPKLFSSIPGNSTWVECLLKLVNVGAGIPIRGSSFEIAVATSLWGDICKLTFIF